MVILGALNCYFCIAEFKYWSYYWRTPGVVNLIFKSSNYGSCDLNVLAECWCFYFVCDEKNSRNSFMNSATLFWAFVFFSFFLSRLELRVSKFFYGSNSPVCTFVQQAGRSKRSIRSMACVELLEPVEMYLILLGKGLEAVSRSQSGRGIRRWTGTPSQLTCTNRTVSSCFLFFF
jgi:hypothetical protein